MVCYGDLRMTVVYIGGAGLVGTKANSWAGRDRGESYLGREDYDCANCPCPVYLHRIRIVLPCFAFSFLAIRF